jgi:spoIIIJ-associated protein
MTKTQEFTGKDVNIAIKNACSALSLSKDKLKYDVISEGTSGIFGIVGRKDARIRVFLPEIDDSEEKEGILSMVDEAFGGGTRREDQLQSFASEIEEEEVDEGDYSDDDYADEDVDAVVDIDEADEEETEEDAVDVTEESAALGVETLQKIADLITEDAKVSAQTEGNRLTLCIEGGNSGILIGRKGQTLDAMQFLTDKIINRKSDARVRVRVDIEGYMETRKSNLKHLAYKMADKAKKTGRPATINQMSAQDRRIVHLALKDDTKVRTQSMGEGYYRRLVIFPKKKAAFKGKRRVKK